MTRAALIAALVLGGCLTRTDLGSQPTDDAGADAAADAAMGELETFVRDLSDGRWRGLAEAPALPPVRVELEFRLDGSYVATCLDDPAPDCLPFPLGAVESGKAGRYWITDRTSNGEYWGRTLDTFRGEPDLEGQLDHMSIAGDELRFVRKQRLSVVELTAAVLVLERAR